MPELSIRFTSDETTSDSPIQVMLFRPDTGVSTDPVPFNPPLDDPELGELRWYLETYSTWPTGPDYERADRLEAQLEDWGRALRQSILADANAGQLWQQFVSSVDNTRLLTIDATDPRVLRLPWELLADEDGHIFSADISVRRRLRKTTTTTPRQQKPFAQPVRVLMVVSRPTDADFIDPRSESRPLMDELDEMGSAVEIEFLYPPTVDALTTRLRDRTAPPVHVVHFDGHGVYDSQMGLGFLLFEKKNHASDPVDANQLGNLLNRCGVPLMVLNACQSAKQEETNPYASVAARLIRSGVGSVLAMNYSVLVAAAHIFVRAFYDALTHGLTVGQAVDAGRIKLLANTDRYKFSRYDEDGKLIEKTLKLKDWFLPALYQQADDPVVFAQDGGVLPAAKPVPRALTDPSFPGGLPAEPLHGFHGRARELLNLERRLADHAVVVVHGFGGLGKTTLAAEAGRWFYRTGRFPGGAAFVSVEHGGSLQQLCSWVGQAVSGDPDFTLGAGDPVERVATLLRERPALVILDNFESVLGAEPLMPAEELQEVLDAVWTWGQAGLSSGTSVTGSWGSRILITTRDTHINDGRFSPSKYCAHLPLDGLALPDARELAANVLEAYSIDRDLVNRQDLERLLINLGGHPLSLNLVLPHLREHTPAELIARFEELLPGFTQGEAQARNESLEVSLEFSLDRLGDETRTVLPALAVFQGGCMEHDLLAITEMDEELWAAARTELEAAALVTVEVIPGVSVPFLQFHPTLLPYLARLLPAEQRTLLETRYWQEYYATARQLYRDDTQHPHQVRAIALRELPNLTHAFGLALVAVQAGAAETLVAVDFADNIARFLDAFGRWRERDALLAHVESLDVTDADGRLTKAEFLQQNGRGEALLQAGRVAEAEAIFETLLARLEAGAAYEADYDRGMTLTWLGRCMAARGLPSQAIQRQEEALVIFERLSASNQTAKETQSKVYTDLGIALMQIGEFDTARQMLETGLAISIELDDQRAVGVKLSRLGELALRQNDLTEAQNRYLEALDTFRKMGEPQSEGILWHQLGMVAEEARDWDEAERCFRESLRIAEQQNDLLGAAQTCNQIAIVATGAGRLNDAEQWLLRAQEIKSQVAPHDASTLNNLASLYLNWGKLNEARQYAERAAAIMETLDLSAEPWKTYNILAQIAEQQGRSTEAAAYRRKERDTRDRFQGTRHEIGHVLANFQGVINGVIAATEGNESAKSQIEAQFDTFRQHNWQIVEAIQRIWAGERDPDALTATIDYNSRGIVLAILHRLGVAVPQMIAELVSGQPAAVPTQDPITRIRDQWREVIRDIIAACQGDTNAAAQLAPFLDEMGQQDDWRALIAVLRRILAGERDADALLAGLDATDAVVAGNVLRGLGVDVPEPQLAAAPQTGDAPDNRIQEILQNFRQVIAAVVAAVQGNAQARAEVEGLFDTLTENGWQIVEPIQHIWAGERDPAVLTAGIDDNSAIIVQAILAVLSEGAPSDAASASPPPGDAPQGEGVSLDQLMDMVKLAASPAAPPGLSQVLHMSTQQMMNDPNAPAEIRALGRVLNAIVSGDRDPDLSALPEELASPVRQLLASLG